MKVIAILGSPRGMTGNTGMLLDGLLDGARAAGADAEVFSLSEYDVEPCRGCEGCHVTGECPVADDFEIIRTAMDQADGLVLASPNYLASITAQLKALLDRCSGPIHRQSYAQKYATAVVTAGSSGCEEVADYLLRAIRLTGCQTVGSVGALGWQMANPDLRGPHLAAATALGRQLAEAIRTKRHFPEQDAERHAMRERMRQLVAMQKDRWPSEYAWWNERV